MNQKMLAIIGVVIVLSVAVVIGIKVNTENTETVEATEEIIVEVADVAVADTDAETTETYTVTFVDSISDETFKEIEVEAGTSVDELPEAPTHDGYEFTEYQGNYSNISSDETVVALYEEVSDDTSDNLENPSSDSSSSASSSDPMTDFAMDATQWLIEQNQNDHTGESPEDTATPEMTKEEAQQYIREHGSLGTWE